MRFHIPIRLPSLSNGQGRMGGWRKLARMKKEQRAAAALAMKDADCPALPSLPVVVTITRIGTQRLDDDNLAASCKYVRDQIAVAFGVDDGSSAYTWRYDQRIVPGSAGGVNVEIVARSEWVKPINWDSQEGVTLLNTLHNCTPDIVPNMTEGVSYARGVLVGVIGALMYAGYGFDEAWKQILKRAPIHEDAIPQGWPALVDYQAAEVK